MPLNIAPSGPLIHQYYVRNKERPVENQISDLASIRSPEHRQALEQLGLLTVVDIASYTPSRHAELLLGLERKNQLAAVAIQTYLEKRPQQGPLGGLATTALKEVNPQEAAILRRAFGVKNLQALAQWQPFVEANRLITQQDQPQGFHERPSAPPALIPALIGSTETSIRLSNYVTDLSKHLNDYALVRRPNSNEPEPTAELLDIFYRSTFAFDLGYLASVKQQWVNAGTHLGEILHSLALAPGESRNIAVLDWYARQRSARTENSTATEALSNEFLQTRALNEVVQTTAQEHLFGMTEVDATTKTSGFGLTGGMGGGAAQNNSVGGGVAADLTSYFIPIGVSASGAQSTGTSSAGALGASYVTSKGTVQGTLQSETSGERTVTGELVQNISDATVQNASNVRSMMSTVVVEDRQSGGARSQTRNITNYNHSHALTMQYFEVLQKYAVNTRANALTPVMYLPFKPLAFNIELIQKYWALLRGPIRKAYPGRFSKWDRVVKDFDPLNNAFDPSGEIDIDSLTITRARTYSDDIKVKLPDANPEVKFKFSGSKLDDTLALKFQGGSTYVDYPVLDTTTKTDGSNMPLDESIECRMSSSFKSRFRSELKDTIEDSKKKADFDRGFNELGTGNNKKNLKDDVDDGNYTLLNPSAGVTVDLDITYTLVDQNGNTQLVTQQHSVTYTYNQLHSEVDEVIFNASDYISDNLITIADINPINVIEDIEAHFEFYKYGYTKYILNALEKEQVIDIVEHLRVDSGASTTALTRFIDPNPLGMVENMLIFKLKSGSRKTDQLTGKTFAHTTVVNSASGSQMALASRGRGTVSEVIRGNRKRYRYQMQGEQFDGVGRNPDSPTNMVFEIDSLADAQGRHPVTGHFDVQQKQGRHKQTRRVDFVGNAASPQGEEITLSAYVPSTGAPTDGSPVIGTPNTGLPDFSDDFDIVVTQDHADEPNTDIGQIIDEYVDDTIRLQKELAEDAKREFVYLPTAGVFGEAILGLSNASEYVDPRRYYNWQDSPIPHQAPQIVAVDINQQRAANVAGSLEPTIEPSALQAFAPLQYPLPTSLNSALQAVQNGSMFTDMSKTDQLASVLGNLSQLANSTAQLAGTLSGEAAANALDGAVALGNQVAALTETALQSNIAPVPLTATEKAAALANLDGVSANPAPQQPISNNDHAKCDAMGTPVDPPTPSPAPTPTPTPNPTPDPVDDGDPASGDSIASLQLALSVPYDMVRLDLAGGLLDLLPAELGTVLATPISIIAEFNAAIGIDGTGDLDTVTRALVLLGNSATGLTELLVLVEGLKILVDLIGLDALDSEILADIEATIYSMVQLMQSLLFPAISGNAWMDANMRVKVEQGQAVHEVLWNRFQPAAINYGYLLHSERDPAGPWWAGDGGWLTTLSASVDSSQLSSSAQIESDGGLRVNLAGDMPIALDWTSVLRSTTDAMITIVRDLLARHAGVVTQLADTIGVADPGQYLIDAIESWHGYWHDNLYKPLNDFFVPSINFDFDVHIAPSTVQGWVVSVTPKHDAFPLYQVSLYEPGNETEDGKLVLYEQPQNLADTLEGPLALISPVVPSHPSSSHSVPAEWFAGWT